MDKADRVVSYDQLLKNVERYLPYLRNLISQFQNEDNARTRKITQMYELLTTQRLKYDNLLKCEAVLIKLYESTQPHGVTGNRLMPNMFPEQTSNGTNKTEAFDKKLCPLQINIEKAKEKLKAVCGSLSPPVMEDTHKFSEKKKSSSAPVDVLKSPPLSIDDIKKLIIENSDSQDSIKSQSHSTNENGGNISKAIRDTLDVLQKSFPSKTQMEPEKPAEETRLAFKYNPHPKKHADDSNYHKISTIYDNRVHVDPPQFNPHMNSQAHVNIGNMHNPPFIHHNNPQHQSIVHRHHQQRPIARAPHPHNQFHTQQFRPPNHGHHPSIVRQFSPQQYHRDVSPQFFDAYNRPPNPGLHYDRYDNQSANNHHYSNLSSINQRSPQNNMPFRQFDHSPVGNRNPSQFVHHTNFEQPPPPLPPLSPQESPSSQYGALNMPSFSPKDPRLRKSNSNLNQMTDTYDTNISEISKDQNICDDANIYRPPDNGYFKTHQVQIDPRLKRLNNAPPVSTFPASTQHVENIKTDNINFPQRRKSICSSLLEDEPHASFPKRRKSTCSNVDLEHFTASFNSGATNIIERNASAHLTHDNNREIKIEINESATSPRDETRDRKRQDIKKTNKYEHNSKLSHKNTKNNFKGANKAKYEHSKYPNKKDKEKQERDKRYKEEKAKPSDIEQKYDTSTIKASQFDKLYRTGDFAKSLPFISSNVASTSFKIPKIKKAVIETEEKLEENGSTTENNETLDSAEEINGNIDMKKKPRINNNEEKCSEDRTRFSKEVTIEFPEYNKTSSHSVEEMCKEEKKCDIRKENDKTLVVSDVERSKVLSDDKNDLKEIIERNIETFDPEKSQRPDKISDSTTVVETTIESDEEMEKEMKNDDDSSDNVVSSSTDLTKRRSTRKKVVTKPKILPEILLPKRRVRATATITTEVPLVLKNEICHDMQVDDTADIEQDDVSQSKIVDKDKEMLESMLSNTSNPDNKKKLLEMLGQILDEKKFKKIQEIIEGPNEDEEKFPANKDMEEPTSIIDTSLDDVIVKPKRKSKKTKRILSESEDEKDDEQQHANLKELLGSTESLASTADFADIKIDESGLKVRKIRKKKNELDKLNDDIREMFICAGVMNATGRRKCTNKESTFPKSPVKLTRSQSTKSIDELIIAETKHEINANDTNEATEAEDGTKLSLRNLKIVVPKLTPTTKSKKPGPKKGFKRKMEAKPEELSASAEDIIQEKAAETTEETLDMPLTDADLSPPKAKRKKKGGWASGSIPKNKKKNAVGRPPKQVEVVKDVKSVVPKRNKKKLFHCQSEHAKVCILCPFNGQNMVQHYVRKHPTSEVYISRLPTNTSEQIKADPFKTTGIYTPTTSQFVKITFNCYFCDEIQSRYKHDWRSHLSSHTGEYRFKCKNCTLLSRTTLLPKAVSHDDNCTGFRMEITNDIKFENNHIFAYMCNLCNYVQLKHVNIQKHMQNEHPKKVTEILKFSILNYNLDAIEDKNEAAEEIDIPMPVLIPQVSVSSTKNVSSETKEIQPLKLADTSLDTSPIKPSSTPIIDKRLVDENNKTPEISKTSRKAVIEDAELIENESQIPVTLISETVVEKECKVEKDLDDDEWEDIENDSVVDKVDSISDASTVNKHCKSVLTTTNPPTKKSDVFQMPAPLDVVKNEVWDIFENKFAIENVGYSIVNQDVWYLCLTDFCKFSTTIRVDIYNHVKEAHSGLIWHGHCKQCDTNVLTAETTDLMKEIKHMMIVHIKNRTSIEEPDELNVEIKPVLKLRRLPGDNLSAVNITSTKAIPFLPAVSVSPNVLKEAATVSIQSSDSTPLEKINALVSAQPSVTTNTVTENIIFLNNNTDVQLKPWTQMKTNKTLAHCRNMMQETSLHCLYKCMGKKCCFTTTTKTMMEQHLDNHELVGEIFESGSVALYKSWLECSYCENILETSKKLIAHISEVHGTSAYQCGYCFYRCRDPYNTIIHQNLNHRQLPNKILVVKSDIYPITPADHELMQKKRIENILPLICTVCSSHFYVLDYYMSHLLNHSETSIKCQVCEQIIPKQRMAKHLLCHNIGIYECIYCHFGTNFMANIRLHVSNLHPAELLYSCVRFNKKGDELNSSLDYNQIEATVLTPIDMTVDEKAYQYCTYSLDELNYKSADTKSNFDIKYIPKPITVISDSKAPSIKSFNVTPPTNTLPSLEELEKFISQTSVNTVKKQNLVPSSDADKIKTPVISSVHTYVDLTDSSATKMPVISQVQGNYVSPKAQVSRVSISSQMPIISNVVGSYTSPQFTNVQEVGKTRNANTTRMPIISSVRSINKDIESIESEIPKEVTPSSSSQYNADLIEDKKIYDEVDRIAYEMIKDTGLTGENLYRCCFKGCSNRSADYRIFNAHLLTHRKSSEFKCFHCREKCPNISSLINHVKSHATHRFFCFLCGLKNSVQNIVTKHILEVHKIINMNVVFLNPNKTNKDTDIMIVCPSAITSLQMKNYYKTFIEIYKHKIKLLLIQKKTHYRPDEIDMLPVQAIFSHQVHCSKCDYNTKVKINMHRHLLNHINDRPVTSVDPKNPVLSVDTSEKYSDTMNLASSSNNDNNTVNNLTYVPELKRYVCGALDCRYLTINETMLKHHLTTLHADENEYKCPHCHAMINNGKMNTDKIFEHLRLHDVKLYKCNKCEFYTNQQNIAEKHVGDKHAGLTSASVLLMRDDSTPQKRTSTDQQDDVLFKFKCDVCNHKCYTRSEIRKHMVDNHKIKSQYQCSKCLYRCTNKHYFTDHFAKQHSNCEIVIISLYHKIEDKDESTLDTTPLWSRDMNKTKNIRGILVEEDEDEDEDEEFDVETNVIINEEASETKLDEIYKNVDSSVLESELFNQSLSGAENKKQSESETESSTSCQKIQKVSQLKTVTNNRKFKMYKCGFENCGYTNDFVSGITTHFKNEHPNMKPSVHRNKAFSTEPDPLGGDIIKFDYFLLYLCYHCNKKYETLEELRRHWEESHKNPKKNIHNVVFAAKPFLFKVAKLVQCGYCPKVSTFIDIKEHTMRSHPNKIFACADYRNNKKCGECDFMVEGTRQELIKHYEIAHKTSSEKSVVEPCDFITDEIVDRLLEMNSTQFECKHCTFKTSEFNELLSHTTEIHKGLKIDYRSIEKSKDLSYICHVCKEVHLSEYSLVAHVRTHLAQFLCKYCNKEFKFLVFLKQHQDIMHNKKVLCYRSKDSADFIDTFKQTRILFWNGLILSNEELAHTKYGGMQNISKLLNEINEDELQKMKRL